MSNQKYCNEFSEHDLEMIESALHTQEKILLLQSRAGGSNAKARLSELQTLLRQVRSRNPQNAAPRCAPQRGWGQFARTLFG